MLEQTGERYLPESEAPEIAYEHWHRYLFASQFVHGKDVLDVASGEGFGAHLLATTARRVVGIDADAAAVEHARARYAGPNLEFRQGCAEAISLDGARRFDVVVSFETIEHLDAEQQLSFVGEIKRLLKPDGIALISTPDKLTYTDTPGYHNPFHRHEFYQRELIAFLGGFFSSVQLHAQRVYPVSYLWSMDDAQGPISEYQLAYHDREGRFGPACGDSKEPLYLIAFCSDRCDAECQAPRRSILVDVSERATQARQRALDAKNRELQTLAAQLRDEQRQVEGLRAQLRQGDLVADLRTQLAALERRIEAAGVGPSAPDREALQRQIQELHAARETTEAEAAALRRTVEEQAEQLCELAELARANANQVQELQAQLLDAHTELVRRDAAFEAALGAALQEQLPGTARGMRHLQLVQQVRRVVQRTLPSDATVLVASLGVDELLDLGGRRAGHFPQAASGGYADFTLAGDAAAIAHLEQLRERMESPRFLLVPRHAQRWLGSFAGFQHHLRQRYRVVTSRPDVCQIFALG